MSDTLQGWALRVLGGTTLADKLVPPCFVDDPRPVPLPEEPGRPPELALLRRSRGRPPRPGQLRTPDERGRVLHDFANHELLALELLCLAVLRFADAPPELRRGLAGIAADEQDHLRAYLDRMASCGTALGDAPVSAFFWDALRPVETPAGFVAGLSLTLEQANLDFSRQWAAGFRDAGDLATADVLDRVYADEIRHVRFGLHWLRRQKDPADDDLAAWRRAVVFPLGPARARGTGPFDAEGRAAAGLDPSFVDAVRTAGASRGRLPTVWEFHPGVEAEVLGRAPPAAITELAADLATLPIVWAADDDVVLAPEPSVAWRSRMVELGFGRPEWVRETASLAGRPLGAAAPWGASPSCRVPGARWDPRWAVLSSKSWAVGGHADVEAAVAAAGPGPWIAKAPFSAAGQDRIRGDGPPTPEHRRWLARTIASQGSVVVEPWLDGVLDLSVQARVDADRTIVLGITRFATTSGVWRGTWTGRWTDGLPPGLLRWIHGPGDVVRRLEDEARTVGAAAAALGYTGPLGIDALVHVPRDGGAPFALRPRVEVNARRTFGAVALALASHQSPGTAGWLQLPRCDAPAALAAALPADVTLRRGRLADGVVPVADPTRARRWLALWWVAPTAADLLARWRGLAGPLAALGWREPAREAVLLAEGPPDRSW